MYFTLLFGLVWNPQPDPSNAEEWLRRGLAIAAREKPQAALPAFTKACDLDPTVEDACYLLGRALQSLDRWDEAVAPLEKALKAASKPNRARVHRAMALNFVALARPVEAERHFRQAVALNTGTAEDPRIDYGTFLFRQGRGGEAATLLREAVRSAPGSARAQGELGRVLLHLGDAAAAVTHLEKAVELNAGAAIRWLLGRAYLQAGREEEGRRELKLAHEALTRD